MVVATSCFGGAFQPRGRDNSIVLWAGWTMYCGILDQHLLPSVRELKMDHIDIPAVIGENKVLPCRAENRPIVYVEWKRTDIKEENILRYRNNAVDTGDQHPSFKDRVVFQDREMKDGDVSLVLINVRTDDSGTYEAEVGYQETENDEKPICSIHLHIAPPSPPPPPPPPGEFVSLDQFLLQLPCSGC
uniref:Ig-like domain-containing protein n=1 Tax=Cyprinodon variegatus TaxID=28743 RepID=A0A3Q2CFR2_CYPVA